MIRALIALPVLAPALALAQPPAFDASAVLEETWTFDILENGQANGTIVVDFGRDDEGVWIHDVSRLGDETHETLLMRFSPDLAPVATVLSGAFGDVRVNAQYHFAGERVTGDLVHYRPADGGYRHVALDEPWSGSLVLRGAAIWLAHTLPWSQGTVRETRWLAPLAGTFADVRLAVVAREQVTVPAGEFSAYRVELTGGSPENVLWITAAEPRRIVRVDVVGQPMSIQLTAHSPRG